VRTIGVVVRHERERADEVAQALARRCDEEGIAVVRLDGARPPAEVEAIVGVGGDGTVLRAACLALEADLPVAGINVGRVGYLAEFAVEELEDLVGALRADRLTVVERMTAEVRHRDRLGYAINDVVVEKVVAQRIVQIGVTINGHPFARYRTDGIIVATPVGSTAYSLAAGGPVVDPGVEALVLTPVAPHSLLSRPIILAPDAVVGLTVEIDRPARINVDGRELGVAEPGEHVEVRRGERRARFLSLGRHPFPQAVRHQFGLEHA